MSANWGYGLAQGLASAADSGVKSIDQRQKEALEARQTKLKGDVDVDTNTRVMQAQQALKDWAEERKRDRAAAAGADIKSRATGLLAAGISSKINSQFGSSIDPNNPESAATLRAIMDNPAAMKAYQLPEITPIDKARAEAEAARAGGHTEQAKELDTYHRSLVTDKSNEARDAREAARDANTAKYQEGIIKNNADRVQMLTQLGEMRMSLLEARLAAANANKDVPAHAKLLVDNWGKQIVELAKDLYDPNKPLTDEGKAEIQGRISGLQRHIYKALGVDESAYPQPPGAPPKAKPPATFFDRVANFFSSDSMFDQKYGPGASAKVLGPPAGTEKSGYIFKGGDPDDRNNWKPKGPAAPAAGPWERFGKPKDGSTAKPAPNEAPIAPSSESVRPKGLLVKEISPQAELIGKQLDEARAALGSVGDAPGSLQEQRKPGSVAAWRQKREEAAARVKELQSEYEKAVGGGVGAYHGKAEY